MKSKSLTAGQIRRLSIAEEIVHGPNLILLDEPITNLPPKDASVIVTGTLRELVNQERTVICSMHQPSGVVFALFDTLALLSKGRLIYMGKADEAASFFIESPTLQFDFKEYANPADFLHDISGCLIYNKKVPSCFFTSLILIMSCRAGRIYRCAST
jgi:ABC-type multidrug transport system ATPase subunit